MKMHRHVVLTSIIIVILLAALALFFFWIEETIPQNNEAENTPDEVVIDNSQEPEDQLYLTIMTHMEQSFMDDKDEDVFLEHVEQLRYAMELAQEVGAILSIESEKPFAIANRAWSVPILREILEHGHGVQTHCDLGSRYTGVDLTAEEYSEAFKENKILVDGLIGEENNIGCSGGAGINDWVTAASLAGFKYLNGIVAGHLLAMDYENRPGEKWTDDYISNEGWHDNLPEDLYESIYPIPLADSNDLIADDDPVIIIMSGTIGPLYYQYEDGDLCIKNGNCELTSEDIDTAVSTILDIAEHYDSERGVAKITIYVQSVLYDEENEMVLKYFFSEMAKLEEQNIIQFGTHKEIYEAYIEQTGFDL
ncbi:hypothetical protein HN358_03645 [Candidatus Uhrbacteria bacterium]|jgi:hypothetical protein|nr:hypothetical protein [Candidatus Uhrbacteria bacterium]MBT7717230.1 hypothetical protein [Candidatus Uhrbacteria bacterium]